MKSAVSWVFEDLKFKISEGYDQNWCFPDPAQLAVSVVSWVFEDLKFKVSEGSDQN